VGLAMVIGSDPAADAQSPEDAVQAWRSWLETRVGR
jgi:hypothetical protein